MYQTILDILKGEEWKDSGVPLGCAERFLFDCFSTAIDRNRNVKTTDELYKNEGIEPAAGFRQTVDETRIAIKELRPIIKVWILLMDMLDKELTYDENRHSIERAAAYMLMNWASIATSELP